MEAISSQLNRIWVTTPTPPDFFEFMARSGDCDDDELVAAILVDLGHRWKTAQPLMIEAYVAGLGHRSLQNASRLELVMAEFRARGLRPTAENILEYMTRFPDLRKDLTVQFAAMARVNQTLNELTYHFEQDSTLDLSAEADEPVSAPKVRYELRKILGEGAFGKVYLGYDHELERSVAIKFPNDKRLADSKHREQYVSEARTVASLNHPNIVPVYDIVRREDGAIYIVSKYIDGCTLEDQIRRKLPSFGETCNIIASVANALDHAHQNQLVHRDVKPGNILLETNTGIVYITDFGLAIKGEQLELQGRISGTPPYMSPEQVRGENHKLDGRSDIFSLGAILYELLTGQRPFDGENPQAVFFEVLNSTPPKPRAINPAIPEDLERICLKALSKNVGQRFNSAAAMASELMRWRRTAKFETLDSDSGTSSPQEQSRYETENNTVGVTIDSKPLSSKPPLVKSDGPKIVSHSKAKGGLTSAQWGLVAFVMLLMLAGVVGIFLNGMGGNEETVVRVEFRTQPPKTSLSISRGEKEQVISEQQKDRIVTLPPGDYRIRISAAEHETLETTLTIPNKLANDKSSLRDIIVQEYKLRPQAVAIRLVTKPTTATITSEGKPLQYDAAMDSFLVAPGTWNLRVESEGYLPLDYSVTVGQDTKVVNVPPLKLPVVLKSNSPDAEFFLNNEKLVSLEGLPNTYALTSGMHEIICRSHDHESKGKTIDVTHERREFEFALSPAGAIVSFEPSVSGLMVSENGKEKAFSSQWSGYLFTPGTHSVRLDRPGYLPQEVTFTVEDQAKNVKVRPWSLATQLEANVANAEYWVDGNRLQPLQPETNRYAIPEGKHLLKIQAKGFESLAQSISVSPDSSIHRFELKVQSSLSTIPVELYQNEMVVVRVTPPLSTKLDLQVGSRIVPLKDGLGQIERSFFAAEQANWPYRLTINDDRTIAGEFTRQQLEEFGVRPTLQIAIPLLDEEQGRRIWQFTRPYLKTHPADSEIALTRALQLAPNVYQIYRDRAICRADLQKFAEAEEDFQICLKHLAEDALVYSVGGLIAIGRGDYLQSRTRLDKAVELSPDSSFAVVLQAMLAYRLKDNKTAKETLEKLVNSTGADDQLAFAKTILAQIAFDEGEFEEAMSLFDAAVLHQIRAGLDATEIQYNRSRGLIRTAKRIASSDMSKSRALLEDAREVLGRLNVGANDPLYIRIRMDMADIEYSLGGYEQALQIYTHLIDDLKLESPRLLQNRAQIYEKLGNADAASKDRKNASLLEQADK